MKVRKIEKKQIKLMDLDVLETNINCSKKKLFNYFWRKDLEFRFKNALNIIFKFHSENKKILFFGTPLKFNKQLKELFKNTNHSFIPEKIWLGGILTNPKSIFRFLIKKYLKRKRNSLKFLFNLMRRNNLAVILNESLSTNPLKELSKLRIPTISLNYKRMNLNNYSSDYKIKQNLNKIGNKSINHLFFSILNTILKKAEKVRIKRIKFNLEQKRIKFKLEQKRIKRIKFKLEQKRKWIKFNLEQRELKKHQNKKFKNNPHAFFKKK